MYRLVILNPKDYYSTISAVGINEYGVPYVTDKQSALAEIDLYTMTNYKNINDAELELYEAGLIDDDIALCIEYPTRDADGHLFNKRIDVLYQKDSGEKDPNDPTKQTDIKMLYFAEEAVNKGRATVNTNTEEFAKLLNYIEGKDGKWLDFMRTNKYIDPELYKRIYNFMFYGRDLFSENKIVEKIMSYRVIRRIYIGDQAYLKQELNIDGTGFKRETDYNSIPGTIIKDIKDADDILYIEPDEEEDESYKDYSDEKWHR